MKKKINIEIIDEENNILDRIEANRPKSNNSDTFHNFKKFINEKVNISNNNVSFYLVNDDGDLLSIDSSKTFNLNKETQTYKIKLKQKSKNENSLLNIFNNNNYNTINEEKLKNVNESLHCWICMEDSPISIPFFCPNETCCKGAHEQCLKKSKQNLIRCACGNIYNINLFKQNKLINDLSEIAFKVAKKNIYDNDKIENLENQMKKFQNFPKRCEIHPDDFKVHFCYDCKKSFCGTCYFTNELEKHINHRLMKYEKYNEIINEVKYYEEQTESIKQELNQYQEKIDEIKEIKEKYIFKLNSIIKEANNKFDDIINSLIRKKEEMNKKKKELFNLKENVKNFFEQMSNKKYNDLSNMEEIKDTIFEDKIVLIINLNEEIKNNIHEIEDEIDSLKFNFDKKFENFAIFQYFSREENGEKYEGELENGEYSLGKLKYGNGMIYEGEFKLSQFEGKGTLYCNNKLCYEGEFKNSLQDGKGILYLEKGRYEGYFKEDQFEGEGVIYYNDGTRQIGNFKEGKEIGKHVIISKNGKIEVKNCE